MNKLQVKVDGVYKTLDIKENESPSFTWTLNSIDEPSNRQTDYSNAISLPWTSNNKRILGIRNIRHGINNEVFKTIFKCRYFTKDTQIKKEWDLVVSEIKDPVNGEKGSIEISIANPIKDFFELLKDYTVYELLKELTDNSMSIIESETTLDSGGAYDHWESLNGYIKEFSECVPEDLIDQPTGGGGSEVTLFPGYPGLTVGMLTDLLSLTNYDFDANPSNGGLSRVNRICDFPNAVNVHGEDSEFENNYWETVTPTSFRKFPFYNPWQSRPVWKSLDLMRLIIGALGYYVSIDEANFIYKDGATANDDPTLDNNTGKHILSKVSLTSPPEGLGDDNEISLVTTPIGSNEISLVSVIQAQRVTSLPTSRHKLPLPALSWRRSTSFIGIIDLDNQDTVELTDIGSEQGLLRPIKTSTLDFEPTTLFNAGNTNNYHFPTHVIDYLDPTNRENIVNNVFTQKDSYIDLTEVESFEVNLDFQIKDRLLPHKGGRVYGSYRTRDAHYATAQIEIYFDLYYKSQSLDGFTKLHLVTDSSRDARQSLQDAMYNIEFSELLAYDELNGVLSGEVSKTILTDYIQLKYGSILPNDYELVGTIPFLRFYDLPNKLPMDTDSYFYPGGDQNNYNEYWVDYHDANPSSHIRTSDIKINEFSFRNIKSLPLTGISIDKDTLEFPTTGSGSFLPFLPEMSCYDYFMGLCTMNGILVSGDSTDKKINFTSYKHIKDKKLVGNYVNWSKYLVSVESSDSDFGSEFFNSSIQQNSNAMKSNKRMFDLNSDLYESKGVVLESEFSDAISYKTEINFPNLITDGTAIVYKTDNRLPSETYYSRHLQKEVEESAITSPDDINQPGQIGDFHVNWFKDYNYNYLDEVYDINLNPTAGHFKDYIDIVNNSSKIKTEMILPIRVIKELDLFKPVFIEELHAYFIIESITDWVDGSTPCEVNLLKI